MARKPLARRIAHLTPLALAGLAAAALTAPAAALAGPSLPSDNGEILYSTTSGAIASIYRSTVADGGSTPQNALPAGTVGSFNGTYTDQLNIADFDGAARLWDFVGGTFGFEYVDVTGKLQSVAYDPADVSQVAWTDDTGLHVALGGTRRDVPQGTGRIAWATDGYVYYQRKNGGIWKYDPIGNADIQLVTNTTAKNPSVTMDGGVLVYELDDAGDQNLYSYIGGGQPMKLPGNSLSDEYLPTISPDGMKLSYVTTRNLGTPEVYVVDFQTNVETRLVTPAADVTGMAWRAIDKAKSGTVSFSVAGELTPGVTLTAVAGQNTGSFPRTDTVGWQRCSLNPSPGAADPNCEEAATGATYTVKNTDAGSYLRPFNRAGNAAGDDVTFALAQRVTITDAVPPAAPTLTEKPDAFVSAQYPQFAWTGAENGGTYECRLIDLSAPPEIAADWAACVSPVKPDALDGGKYRFEVRQVDGAGNKGAATTHTFEVDLVDPPKPVLGTTPAAVTTDAASTFTFEKTGTEPTTFECRIDGNFGDGPTWVPCASPFTTPQLDQGYHTFEVRQVDRAGNTSSRATFDWYVDELLPAPTVVGAPQSSTSTTATITFESITTVECSLDGGAWTVCESPLTLTDLAVGDHALELRQLTKRGSAGTVGKVAWTVEGAEQPKPPVVETPAPVTPAPAVEAPKPAATAPVPVEAPKPAAKPAATKAPALVATIGGTKTGPSTSADATIEVAKESVGVGCSITGTVLKSCKVDLYAAVASGATARAAAAKQVLVGTGTYVAKNGASKMDVKIDLNATGKAMLRKRPDGLKVTVKITGQPVSGKALNATGTATLVTDRASATIGGFAVSSAALTPAAKKQLRLLAKFGKAASVRCVGHTDGSSDDASYLKELGADRAKAVCGYLAKLGVKATKRTLVSKADTVPASTNTTKAGRAQNRRVVVTLVR